MRCAPFAAAIARHQHPELAGSGLEAHHASPVGHGRLDHGAPQRGSELAGGIRGIADVDEDRARNFDQHGVQLRRVGQIEGEDEIVIGHAVGFYSESRLKSTRARWQSASICARRRSSDSNARSSRRRWTNPRRMVAPYRSRSRLKTCVSIVARPDWSTVGRVPMLVTDGYTISPILIVVA